MSEGKAEMCVERVWDSSTAWGRHVPCKKKATKDGYCGVHHPDAKKARQARSEAAFKAKQERSPWFIIERMRDKYKAQSDIAKELAEALDSVHKIICEGATTGFNYASGDWTERLFLSNQKTSAALTKYRESLKS